jgi:imidazole glycerol phosphate synthase subunit HisF
VRLDDPVAVARGWARAGFTRLHVVDLDAATGRGSNAEVIRAIAAAGDTLVQVGGGVRGREAIRRLLEEADAPSWSAPARCSIVPGSRARPTSSPAVCWCRRRARSERW